MRRQLSVSFEFEAGATYGEDFSEDHLDGRYGGHVDCHGSQLDV